TGVTVSSNSFTPNGDGVNDALRIEYTLLQLVGEAPVEVRIYDLSGRSVWTDRRMEQNGNYDRDWDGTDDNHDPVPPGLYVYSIEVGGDEKVLRTFGTVAVIY
ncbi:MAG: gliding motility-associated C-terminal domain-containing protein, partial [Candidatus Latescibacteria bacterium]|nr:gliding motility-associated C-terminal domain-containing protein [Candidatus Latescibacterota bacterium]